jgi:hypothetical protein
MADNSGGNALLGLVLGGLVVFVAIAFVYGWGPARDGGGTTIKIEPPKIVQPKGN